MKVALCSICYARKHCVISVKAMMLVRVQHMQILAGSTEWETHRERRGLMQKDWQRGGDSERERCAEAAHYLSLPLFLCLSLSLPHSLSLHQH